MTPAHLLTLRGGGIIEMLSLLRALFHRRVFIRSQNSVSLPRSPTHFLSFFLFLFFTKGCCIKTSGYVPRSRAPGGSSGGRAVLPYTAG